MKSVLVAVITKMTVIRAALLPRAAPVAMIFLTFKLSGDLDDLTLSNNIAVDVPGN
jgi:hypothetical protein